MSEDLKTSEEAGQPGEAKAEEARSEGPATQKPAAEETKQPEEAQAEETRSESPATPERPVRFRGVPTSGREPAAEKVTLQAAFKQGLEGHPK